MKNLRLEPWSYAAKAGDPTTPLDTHLKKNMQKRKREINNVSSDIYWIKTSDDYRMFQVKTEIFEKLRRKGEKEDEMI